MQRLDEEITSSADASTIVWRLSGEVLCRVERVGDLLQASVAPRHDSLPLGDLADLDRLVERALARLVGVLGLTRGEKPPGPPEPARAREGRAAAQRRGAPGLPRVGPAPRRRFSRPLAKKLRGRGTRPAHRFRWEVDWGPPGGLRSGIPATGPRAERP
jgi:hypothetical protein